MRYLLLLSLVLLGGCSSPSSTQQEGGFNVRHPAETGKMERAVPKPENQRN